MTMKWVFGHGMSNLGQSQNPGVVHRSHKMSTRYYGRIAKCRPECRQDLILWQYVLQAYNFVVFLILVEVTDYSLNYGHRRFVDAYLVVPKKILQPATFYR